MTIDELDALAGRTLWERVKREAGVTRAMLAAFLSDGIPRPIAVALEKSAGIPLSAWDTILESSLLRHDGSDSTIRTMNVNTEGQSAAVKRGAARATRKHVAQQKFYEAGKTITQVAEDMKLTREQVSSWMAKGSGNRPIPARYAELLRKTYGIPRSAWTRIAD